MIVPYTMIPTPNLQALIKEFVLQGVDFDASTITLETQCAQVMNQLADNSAVVTFSELHETFNISTTEKFKN